MILVATGLVGLLLCAPAAAATAPARDEYTLELPGARDSNVLSTGLTGSPTGLEPGPRAGIAGEAGSTQSPLSSTLSTILGAPLAVAIALTAVAALFVLTRLRPRPPRLR